jgi:type VI secretion system FHA domain protein
VGLTLELVSSGAEQPPAVAQKAIGAAGGTIGRAKHSDWVLPDSKVSSRHARITCENSVYYIEDTSTNGICLNSPDNRLEQGRLYALHAGDRLFINPYEILVSITSDRDETRRRAAVQAPPVLSADPFRFDDAFGAGPAASMAPPSSDPFAAVPVPHPDDELDPLKLLDTGPPQRVIPAAPVVSDLAAGSPLDAHFRPPAIVLPTEPDPPPAPPRAVLIPDNYNPLAPETGIQLVSEKAEHPFDLAEAHVQSPGEPSGRDSDRRADPVPPLPPPVPVAAPVKPRWTPPERLPPPVRTDAPAASPVTGDLAGVLEAAGLHNVPVTPELAQKFGEILRVVVSGVMDVLHSRQQVKDEFRMRQTYFRPVDNNPLKFSVNVEDALHNLLVKRNEAYLGPVEAFEDAFEDLRNHQLAMLAGMRVAFDCTLAEFAVDRLQEQFDRHLGKNSVFAVAAKMRYWDLFREHQEEIARDPEATFRRLFGDAFTRAYEEQLKRLKEGRGRG